MSETKIKSYSRKNIKSAGNEIISNEFVGGNLTDIHIDRFIIKNDREFIFRKKSLTSSDPKGGCRGFPHTSVILSNCHTEVRKRINLTSKKKNKFYILINTGKKSTKHSLNHPKKVIIIFNFLIETLNQVVSNYMCFSSVAFNILKEALKSHGRKSYTPLSTWRSTI